MVEAIPLSNESIMLIITKIEDPEELDTRFSKFAPMSDDEEPFAGLTSELLEGADSLLEMLAHNAASALPDHALAYLPLKASTRHAPPPASPARFLTALTRFIKIPQRIAIILSSAGRIRTAIPFSASATFYPSTATPSKPHLRRKPTFRSTMR